jgi:hypothetical protein
MKEILMQTADANAAALPPNAQSRPCNPIGAGSAWAVIRNKSFNYLSKYAELAHCSSTCAL